jgi:hypothetical protein
MPPFFAIICQKPRHGTLLLSDNQEWYFYPGKSMTGHILPYLSIIKCY